MIKKKAKSLGHRFKIDKNEFRGKAGYLDVGSPRLVNPAALFTDGPWRIVIFSVLFITVLCAFIVTLMLFPSYVHILFYRFNSLHTSV